MTTKADYLKRYLSGNTDTGDLTGAAGVETKKRRRKKTGAALEEDGGVKKIKNIGAGVRIHDTDVDDWKRGGEKVLEGLDDAVVVDASEIEQREEKRRTYLGIKEDGSGWAVATDGSANANGNANAAAAAAADDASPPRRGRHDTDDDASPARRGGNRHDSDDEDNSPPPAARGRHDTDDKNNGDLSPPRAGKRRDGDDDDASWPRRPVTKHDDDVSPPRRPKTNDSPDLSPPRRVGTGKGGDDDNTNGDSADVSMRGGNKRGVMTDGTTAGLVDASVVVREADAKRTLARQRINQMSDDTSGKNAGTLFRDKATGRLIDADELARRKELAAKAPSREKPVWASGVAQAREAADRQMALAEESAAPFARGEIDTKTDDSLRAANRFGDPMAHLARRNRLAELDAVANTSAVAGVDAEKLQKSGFRIPQDVPQHSWMRRGVGVPSNRFGIKPGRHWDGVDRGTGFEHEMFKAKNDASAKKQRDWKYGQAQWE